MTTIMLDPQPDGPECFRIDATTALRNAPPSDDRPRLACEWKRTADGRMTCTWLSDASPAWVPVVLRKEGFVYPPQVEMRARSIGGEIAATSQDLFPGWIWPHPRQAKTLVGLATAVVLLGLAAADSSRSTTPYSREPKQVSVANTRVVPAVTRPPTMDNVQAAAIDPDVEYFLGAADGSSGVWIRPPTLRPQSH
jgi:hypothetical protein